MAQPPFLDLSSLKGYPDLTENQLQVIGFYQSSFYFWTLEPKQKRNNKKDITHEQKKYNSLIDGTYEHMHYLLIFDAWTKNIEI
jgi:hypothetical protein